MATATSLSAMDALGNARTGAQKLFGPKQEEGMMGELNAMCNLTYSQVRAECELASSCCSCTTVTSAPAPPHPAHVWVRGLLRPWDHLVHHRASCASKRHARRSP